MPIYKHHTRPQDKKFVKEYLRTGNGTESALEAYNTDKRTSAASISVRKLKSAEIQELIRQEAENQGITLEYIVDAQKQIIDRGLSTLSEVRVLPADINKSLERLTKIMGLDGNGGGSGNSGHKHIHLHEAQTRTEVIEKRKEFASFFETVEGT